MTSLPSSNAAFLGVQYNPFQTYGYPTSPSFRVRNMVLPDGVDAKTLRGKLVLRATDSGQLAGEAPLDVYVSRA